MLCPRKVQSVVYFSCLCVKNLQLRLGVTGGVAVVAGAQRRLAKPRVQGQEKNLEDFPSRSLSKVRSVFTLVMFPLTVLTAFQFSFGLENWIPLLAFLVIVQQG